VAVLSWPFAERFKLFRVRRTRRHSMKVREVVTRSFKKRGTSTPEMDKLYGAYLEYKRTVESTKAEDRSPPDSYTPSDSRM